MLGGAVGAGCRYGATRAVAQMLGTGAPWGTWIVNLSGGFLMGVLAALMPRLGPSGESLRMFLAVGVLGGFTTFSAFSLETHTMLLRGQYAVAAAYILSSVAGSLIMLVAGIAFVRIME